MDYLIFVISLSALIWGADVLIAQSERIALRFNISEYVIGATLIALGTSLPEMAASIAASLDHKPELAVSNVIGSNILNITLVLASVFLLAKKVDPHRDFFAKDSSWALFPVLLFVVMAMEGEFTRFDGVLLLLLMGAYLLFLKNNGSEVLTLEDEEIEEIEHAPFRWPKVLLMLALGFVLVIVGAEFTVESASSIAKSLGVSEWIIGIVLVSMGTSMPELIVSIVAAVKGKADMAIGNIIGSNMANITMVLGSAALVNDLKVDLHHYLFDIATMVAATLMLVFITANRMYSKPAGISLLALLALFLHHIAGQLG
ncbi:calcium/sodium antiporter [Nitratifractor salsuginis]|uniref:Na+/Ca+ antiporter, CaCA family n=1 Tax=Nitratifractor salsuginis (strain DSM 16511 / JCM 12458 / E9I37-1) TaxID=749222 RepID=E6X052_NITSE|nr:calcium/sodium antiporter [Nitratifractor salsuginis]ADV46775.1 Na+/Ca+ antiporter, CaCA family [Nitratifractor salsuginis DSM 16511]